MNERSSETGYWIAFTRIPRIGTMRVARLQAYFGTMAEAWRAGPSDLRIAGLDQATVSSIVEERANIDPLNELDLVRKAGVKAYTWNDPEYPARLKEIDDKPPVLFVRGDLVPDDEWAVAVVGTRMASPYGRQEAEQFSAGLARQGITVVSGLARGIDGVAHRTALATGGRTIAVLACGLDIIYPPEHVKLATEISQRGALVSEYPLGTKPRADYFPRRNRILSGISLGVLVIEGSEKSGALITARAALDQNREVFALPGEINRVQSEGPNKLIQKGEAKLVRCTEDILEELNLTMTAVAPQLELREVTVDDPTEASLLKVLTNQPLYIDDVQRASGLPIASVSSALALLELKGLVRQVGPMSFIKAREVTSHHRS